MCGPMGDDILWSDGDDDVSASSPQLSGGGNVKALEKSISEVRKEAKVASQAAKSMEKKVHKLTSELAAVREGQTEMLDLLKQLVARDTA